MINMKQALSFFCLFLLVACGGKDLGPEPRTRDEIFRELANLPVLYISKSGKRVEAPGGKVALWTRLQVRFAGWPWNVRILIVLAES